MVDTYMSTSRTRIEPLTRRECEVLKLLAENMSDREIADQLVLSINSVKWFARRIYEKLEVGDRRNAVKRAQQLGLLAGASHPAAPVHNLPRQVTPLVGRKLEIPQVVELIWHNQLVTMTGSGGVGKTRLALAAAHELLDDFPDGVRYVDLAALMEPGMVVRTVMGSLGVFEEPSRDALDSLAFYFNNRQILLLLDNCEHLADACAKMIDRLMRIGSGLKLLVTSREPLMVEGEVIYRVPGLAYPTEAKSSLLEEVQGFDSVELFVRRAQLVVPHFSLDHTNCNAVAQICHRLDGIPLAIELAASRCASLGVMQIAERLVHSFRLLANGERTKLERYRTLRSAIEWSYQLISEEERILLRRLGVFVGGWTLEAAEKVCAGDQLSLDDIPVLLGKLVDKSLVQVEHLDAQEPRYRMLATIQQFSLEELFRSGESETLRAHHFDWVIRFSQEAQPHLYSRQLPEWIKRLRSDHNNIHAALVWSIEEGHDMQGGTQILWALNEKYWCISDAGESIRLMTKVYEYVKAHPGLPLSFQVQVIHLLCQSSCSEKVGVLEGWAQKGLEMTVGPDEESRLERGYFLSILAKCFYNIHGQFQPALEMVQEAEGILRQLGTKGLWALAQTLSEKTWILRFMGHLNAAEACCDECTRIFLDLGDEWSNVYWQMAESAKRQGNFELAKKYCVIERERSLEIDSYTSVANIDRMLANWERERGMYEEAKILYQNSLRTYDRMASMAGLSLALGGLASNQAGIAQILQEEKAHRTWMGAARILAGIKTAQEEYHLPTYHEDRQIYDEAYEKVKGALPVVDLERAWAEGRVMRLKEVVMYALNE